MRPRPFDDSLRALHERLGPDEQVVAEGRMDEFDLSSGLPGGSGHDVLVVTNRRVLVAAPGLSDDRSRDYAVRLDDVLSYAEETIGHRWALILRHPPQVRIRHRAKHNVLWMHWGNVLKEVTMEESGFVFSRRNTSAARALRESLADREVPEGTFAQDVVTFSCGRARLRRSPPAKAPLKLHRSWRPLNHGH